MSYLFYLTVTTVTVTNSAFFTFSLFLYQALQRPIHPHTVSVVNKQKARGVHVVVN